MLTVYPFMQKNIVFFAGSLQMSAISAQQMQTLDMNSVCMDVGCFMHAYVVYIFDVNKIFLRFSSF